MNLSFARKLVKKDKNFFLGHARLAEIREGIGLTQQAAAEKYGVTRVTWGQWERGGGTPSADVLAGMALDGADVHYILTGNRKGNFSHDKKNTSSNRLPTFKH